MKLIETVDDSICFEDLSEVLPAWMLNLIVLAFIRCLKWEVKYTKKNPSFENQRKIEKKYKVK